MQILISFVANQPQDVDKLSELLQYAKDQGFEITPDKAPAAPEKKPANIGTPAEILKAPAAPTLTTTNSAPHTPAAPPVAPKPAVPPTPAAPPTPATLSAPHLPTQNEVQRDIPQQRVELQQALQALGFDKGMKILNEVGVALVSQLPAEKFNEVWRLINAAADK